MSLFVDRARTNAPRTKQADESLFQFCDRLDLPTFVSGRRIVNELFDKYPEDFKSELRARLTSRADSDHFSALFELQLHGLLSCHGIELKPLPPRAHQRTPDFVFVDSDDARAYVEATVRLGDRSDAFFTFLQHTTRRVLKTTRRLRIWVNEKITTSTTASSRHFAAFLLGDFRRRTEGVNLASLQSHKRLGEIEFDDDESGWRIRCTLIAWHIDNPPRSTIALATGLVADWSQAVPMLREEIEAKRRQHRDADLPVFIAISWHDLVHKPDHDDIQTALAGNGADMRPLAIPGLVMAGAATVWGAPEATMELWHPAAGRDHPFVQRWPFPRYTYDESSDATDS